jgi:hypothetical protein
MFEDISDITPINKNSLSVPQAGQNKEELGEGQQLKYCQSCGMPFDEAHHELAAKETDGSNSIYCIYCYKDGAFLDTDATAESMIEMGVPHLAYKIGEQAAREQLSKFVPTLARWKDN